MYKVLVTGAAGFIGSTTVERLLKKDKRVQVVGLDNFDDNYPIVYKKQNVALLKKYSNFSFYTADIRDEKAMRRIFKKEKFDTVLHLAAKADSRHAVEEPSQYVQTNVIGTLNLLECSKEFGIKRFIFASSSSVYGNGNRAPYKETANTDFAISPYGATKKAGEMLAFTYHHNFGLSVMCVRIFNAYGPRMRTGLVLYRWVEDLFTGKPVEISGTGARTRDFTYVDDIADALIKAAKIRKPQFEIVNVGSATPVSLTRLLKVVEKATGEKARVVSRPSARPSVEKTHASITKAKEVLGWEPTTTLEDGVSRFVEWFCAERLKEEKKSR